MNKISNPLELIKEFQEMGEPTLETLEHFLYHRVGLFLNVRSLKIGKEVNDCWHGLQMTQLPNELAKLLMYIYSKRNEIHTYCEIGVARFGTFYVIDSFLRAFNPNFKRSVAVDIQDRLMKKHHFAEYAKERDVVFIHNNSSAVKEESFDLCFIDGDHSYDGVKTDYERMKENSKILLFHDIVFYPTCQGVIDFWNEIKTKDSLEFLNEDPKFPIPVGIGVL